MKASSATKGGEKTGTLVALGDAPAARGGELLSHDELGRAFGRLVSRVSLRKNKDVIVAGARYDVFYLVQQGWLIQYKILHDGRRQIVDFVLPGEVFGLQSCLFKTSLYSVSTITDALVSAIRVGAIDATFEASNPTPKLAKALFGRRCPKPPSSANTSSTQRDAPPISESAICCSSCLSG